jgi:hypothetical protein
VFAELAPLADRVHGLAQQVGVGELVDVGAWVALPVLPLERFDLVRGLPPEVRTQRISGFQCRRVDQDGALPGGPGAILHVAQQRQPSRGGPGGAIGLLDLAAGDPVVDQLRRHCVRADHDQHRRRFTQLRLDGYSSVCLQYASMTS